MVAIGVALIAVTALIDRGGQEDLALSIPGVEALIPQRNDEVLQQQQVGIDLSPEYRLVEMTISANANCAEAVTVTAHVRRVDGLAQFLYQPAANLPVEALAPDQNCVTATIEKISEPGIYTDVEWGFTVN